MPKILALAALGAALAWTSCRSSTRDTAPHFDVVVYGGTSGGVTAAVAAARAGCRALLLEPGRHLGGLSSSGLGATDIGNKAAIGGLAREFYRRVREHYGRDAAWRFERRDEFGGRGHDAGDDAAWTFEPHVAERIFDELAGEPGVTVLRGARLDRDAGVRIDREHARIEALRLVDGRAFTAGVFVDATYEGDLLAAAGVAHRIGREANAEFDETLNGVQTARAVAHQFTHRVDPYRVPGEPGSGLLPGIEARPPEPDGSADHRVQAYCFRMTTTDVAENRREWTRPDGYDERDHELLLRNFDAGDRRVPWHPVWMPNRKTDTNNNFAVSTDFIGGNHGWAAADDAGRERIFAAHLRWQQGLMWTLANHPRVPAEVRAEFQRLGLTKDEFVDYGGWPPRLYVREGRRMVGSLVMTERHCRGLEVADDPVGLGAYGMDSHHVRRHVDASGAVRNEGDVQVHGFDPYPIGYGAITPRRDECTNLLVPVALSATHIAFGSIRMEPVFCVLGESAGIAAALAIESGVPVQDVDRRALRERLERAGQVLEWSSPSRGRDPRALGGIVVDDRDAELHGPWLHSRSVAGFVGAGYLHDGGARKGECRAVFTLHAPRAGRYSLRLAQSPHGNRTAALPVVVESARERFERRVDQREAGGIDGLWCELAQLVLDAGERVTVSIDNRDTLGHVIVDAVQAVPVQGR